MSIEHLALLAIVGVSELIALACVPSLWRSNGSIAGRVVWTLLLAVPLVGPVAYGTCLGGFPGPGDGVGPAPPRRPGGGSWI